MTACPRHGWNPPCHSCRLAATIAQRTQFRRFALARIGGMGDAPAVRLKMQTANVRIERKSSAR